MAFLVYLFQVLCGLICAVLFIVGITALRSAFRLLPDREGMNHYDYEDMYRGPRE